MAETNTVNETKEFDLASLSKEELYKLVESKGLVKEFAAEAKLLKTLDKQELIEKTKKQKKSETTFELIENDHNDFIIRKETGRSWKMLAVMTSQGTAMIKDAKGTTMLTGDSKDMLAGFLRGMERMEIPNCWIGHLQQGSAEAHALIRAITLPDVMEGFKYNVGPRYRHDVECTDGSAYEQWRIAWKKHRSLMIKFAGNRRAIDLIISGPGLLEDIEQNWGFDNAVDFINNYCLSLIDSIQPSNGWGYYARRSEVASIDSSWGSSPSRRPKYNMEYKAFRDYCLYDAVRLGFAYKWTNFFDLWSDTLRMQVSLYGKIKNKYPKYLQSEHDILSYKYNLFEEEIDERNFKIQAAEASKFEYSTGDYVFIAPRVKQDFYDEAEMQQNCLASYVKKFCNRECFIMFMRKKDTPEESLVTIELIEGKVVQKYQARNVITTDEQDVVIDKWLKDCVSKVLENKKGC